MTHVSCPDDSILTRLCDDELADAEHAVIVEHLDDCDDCRDRLDAVAGFAMAPPRSNRSGLDVAVCPDTDYLIQRLVSSGAPSGESDDDASAEGVTSDSTSPDDIRTQVPRDGGDHAAGRTGSATSDHFIAEQLEAPRTDDSLGTLDRYDILSVPGQGGMGIVFKGRDPQLARLVAIKVLSPSLVAIDEARIRFLREGQIAASIEHENVVTIHAVDEWKGTPYLVVQFVDGPTLREVVAHGGRLSPDRVIRYARQMAGALAAAHEHGIVHRDIKPSNVLLDPDTDQVRVTDFGLARAVDDHRLTQTGVVAGTPQFMSPEQAEGAAVDERSDLFSLGSVLYFLATGREPYSGTTTVSILRKICDESPPPVSELNPDVPLGISRTIERLMSRQPERRFRTAADVVEALSDQALARADSRTAPIRKWSLIGLTAISAAVIAMATLNIDRLWRPSPMAGDSASLRTYRPPTAPDPVIPDSAPVVDKPVTPQAPFRIVGRDKSFDSLERAVKGAVRDDVIEIHDNGPHEITPIRTSKPITIRGANGIRPVITLAESGRAEHSYLIFNTWNLTLENLVIEDPLGELGPKWNWGTSSRGYRESRCAIVCQSGRLVLHNCLIRCPGPNRGLLSAGGPSCEIRDCFLFCGGAYVPAIATGAKLRNLQLENSVLASQVSFRLNQHEPLAAEIAITNSTVRGRVLAGLHGVESRLESHGSSTVAVRMTVRNSILDIQSRMCFTTTQHDGPVMEMGLDQAQRIARSWFHWDETSSVVGRRLQSLATVVRSREVREFPEPDTAEEWLDLTGQPAGSVVAADIEYSTEFADDQPEYYRIRSVTGDGVPEDVALGANVDSFDAGVPRP